MIDFYRKNRKKILTLILVTYWVALFIATSLPDYDIPKINVNDKVEHFIAYFILAFMLSVVLLAHKKIIIFKNRIFIAVLVIVGAYASIDELHQLFIPGRSCDLLDWIADFSSACFAVLIVYIFSEKIYPRFNTK